MARQATKTQEIRFIRALYPRWTKPAIPEGMAGSCPPSNDALRYRAGRRVVVVVLVVRIDVRRCDVGVRLALRLAVEEPAGHSTRPLGDLSREARPLVVAEDIGIEELRDVLLVHDLLEQRRTRQTVDDRLPRRQIEGRGVLRLIAVDGR